MSMADIIQMGVELAMAATGGPRVSLGRGKRDVDTADENDLPGAGDTYAELKAFYGSKGFNVREMVVSQVGGHSIGSFAGIDFSPNPTSFDNAYATNLLNILENGESLPGHNELPSDLQMITDPEAVIWIKFYADSTRTASGRTQGFVNLNRDFARYLVKQGRLTSSRV